MTLPFPGSTHKKIIEHLRTDSEWLAEQGLIDYSLLVGVHRKDPAKKHIYDAYETMDVVCTKSNDELCYIGIVDILTKYRMRKVLETFCCGTLCCFRDISCQPPGKYAKRFFGFMQEICVSCEESSADYEVRLRATSQENLKANEYAVCSESNLCKDSLALQ